MNEDRITDLSELLGEQGLPSVIPSVTVTGSTGSTRNQGGASYGVG